MAPPGLKLSHRGPAGVMINFHLNCICRLHLCDAGVKKHNFNCKERGLHLCSCTYCILCSSGTDEAEQICETEKRLKCMNEPNCIDSTSLHYTPSCMSCMCFGFSFPPPGSVCWWGLPRRTPPSLALWRLGPSTTAPGLDSPTAADRYLLTIPVSNLKAFSIFIHVMNQNKFTADLLGAPPVINMSILF